MSALDTLDPRDLPWQVVAECCEDDLTFIKVAGQGAGMVKASIAAERTLWRLHWGLLTGDDLQRLLWLVNTFAFELEVDLKRLDGLSLKALWQGREWRRLLNHIDRMPSDTWTQTAMVNHPEHASRLAEQIAAAKIRGDIPDKPLPSAVTWSPEVAALSAVVDAVNSVRHAVIKTADPNSKIKAPEPVPRPDSAVARLIGTKERTLRWRAHESLADRLLPGRRAK